MWYIFDEFFDREFEGEEDGGFPEEKD